MKRIITFCLLMILPFVMFSQKSVNKFYTKYKRADNTINFTLPGFVLGLGASIGRKQMDKEDQKALMALELTKSIKSIRFLVMEETNLVSQKDYNNLIEGLKKKDKISELITVREGSMRINIMIRDKRKHISNLIIIVSEEDEFVMISMKTRLRYKDLNKFLKEIMKNDEKIKVVPDEPEKVVKKVIPRA
jgi:DNA primase catalytic subunit